MPTKRKNNIDTAIDLLETKLTTHEYDYTVLQAKIAQLRTTIKDLKNIKEQSKKVKA